MTVSPLNFNRLSVVRRDDDFVASDYLSIEGFGDKRGIKMNLSS